MSCAQCFLGCAVIPRSPRAVRSSAGSVLLLRSLKSVSFLTVRNASGMIRRELADRHGVLPVGTVSRRALIQTPRVRLFTFCPLSCCSPCIWRKTDGQCRGVSASEWVTIFCKLLELGYAGNLTQLRTSMSKLARPVSILGQEHERQSQR